MVCVCGGGGLPRHGQHLSCIAWQNRVGGGGGVSEDDGENEDLGRGTLTNIHLKEGEEVGGVKYTMRGRVERPVCPVSCALKCPIMQPGHG
jgi:hypothetical protein